MSGKTPFLFLLLAMLAVVVFSGGDDGDEDGEDANGARESRSGEQPPDLYGRPGRHHGLQSASWWIPGGETGGEGEVGGEPEPEAIAVPPAYRTDDDPENRIPDEVRERLARDYMGLDIAVGRPPRNGEGTVRK